MQPEESALLRCAFNRPVNKKSFKKDMGEQGEICKILNIAE